jgi:hypothetical protein
VSKKVTVTYTVTYDLSKGSIAQEYYEGKDDRRDSRAQRKWFAIDRFIGHDNLRLFDRKAKLKVTEEEVV